MEPKKNAIGKIRLQKKFYYSRTTRKTSQNEIIKNFKIIPLCDKTIWEKCKQPSYHKCN